MGNNMIKSLLGKVIRVDRGGHESRIGRLMDVSDDHIVLFTEEEGFVYYNAYHIRSLTENLRGNMKFNKEIPKEAQFKKASNFTELLNSLKFQWVKINRGGPVKIEGLLSEVNKDLVSVIHNDEIIRLSTFHMRSISL